MQSLIHTYKRFRTLQTSVIKALPVVILMPHSACNCRCVMCDIWKDNKNLKQLHQSDITGLLSSLKKLETQQVVMSGGEALLNQNFFSLCEILRGAGISVSLLSTGLTLKHHAVKLLNWVNDVIVSIDGDEALHDAIRNIPGAFNKLEAGVKHLKELNPAYRITGRCVIHRLNFRNWEKIISAAKNMGVDQISFLPADVSSEAFNRQTAWTEPKQHEILIPEAELPELQAIINRINADSANFETRFIAESRAKLQDIYNYYAAFYNFGTFPFKKCNAPWVSTVVEADGSVRPCFFHDVIGNIHDNTLTEILNGKQGMDLRKNLNMAANPTCIKCVCSLNLRPHVSLN